MSGIVTVGEDPTPVCAVPPLSVVRVKSIDDGSPPVYLGGPDVTAGNGYLLEAGHPSEQFTGSARIKQTPIVPAPASDTDLTMLYGVTDPGAGQSRVSWIAVS